MEICVSDYTDLSDVKAKAIDTKGKNLEPLTQKSFYGKAKVYAMPNGDEVLVSYVTPVVLWVKELDTVIKLQENNRYTTSHTTMNHIRAFMYRHNKDQFLSVKEWRKVAV